MNKINWKVRFTNWPWLAAFISQLMIVLQLVLVGANAVGLTDFQLTEEIQTWVLALANAIFIALSMVGLVQDPTTEKITDSPRARTYDFPKHHDDHFIS